VAGKKAAATAKSKNGVQNPMQKAATNPANDKDKNFYPELYINHHETDAGGGSDGQMFFCLNLGPNNGMLEMLHFLKVKIVNDATADVYQVYSSTSPFLLLIMHIAHQR
jgi:hypothetical protein